MSCNNSCSCCRKIRYETHTKKITSLKNDGYTYQWTPKNEWRDRWWFFGKKRKQQKEIKIGYIFEVGTPIPIYRWKTKKIL